MPRQNKCSPAAPDTQHPKSQANKATPHKHTPQTPPHQHRACLVARLGNNNLGRHGHRSRARLRPLEAHALTGGGPLVVLVPGRAHGRVDHPTQEEVGIGGRLTVGAPQVELARLPDHDLVRLSVDVRLRDARVGVALEGEDYGLVVGGVSGMVGA